LTIYSRHEFEIDTQTAREVVDRFN